MFNTNRFGHDRPPCNARQYGTMEFASRVQGTKLKPEYLNNEHYKFVKDFGINKEINVHKQFVDINNCVNHNPNTAGRQKSSHNQKMPNVMSTSAYPNISHSYNIDERKPNSTDNLINDKMKANKTEFLTNQKIPVHDINTSTSIHNLSNTNNTSTVLKRPKTIKQNINVRGQDSSKYSRKFGNHTSFSKKSKKETDRYIINKLSAKSSRRKYNRSKYPELDIVNNMDVDEPDFIVQSPSYLQEDFIPSTSIDITVTTDDIKQPGVKNNDVEMCNSFRSRIPSECESEDSFIVFEGSEDVDVDKDFIDTVFSSEQESDEESNDDNDDTSSNDDTSESILEFDLTSHDDWHSHSRRKKVRFVEDKDLCEIHPMVQWSFAYKSARKGPWEQIALDRMRFKDRITNLEPTLDSVLQPLHRDKIFKERFQTDSVE